MRAHTGKVLQKVISDQQEETPLQVWTYIGFTSVMIFSWFWHEQPWTPTGKGWPPHPFYLVRGGWVPSDTTATQQWEAFTLKTTDQTREKWWNKNVIETFHLASPPLRAPAACRLPRLSPPNAASGRSAERRLYSQATFHCNGSALVCFSRYPWNFSGLDDFSGRKVFRAFEKRTPRTVKDVDATTF